MSGQTFQSMLNRSLFSMEPCYRGLYVILALYSNSNNTWAQPSEYILTETTLTISTCHAISFPPNNNGAREKGAVKAP